MKKFLLFVLIAGVVLLSGCASVGKLTGLDLPPVPTAETAADAYTPASPTSNLTETEHQHIIINFEQTKLEAYDPREGTELILSFSYETPYVHIPANMAAEERVNEYIAMLNESFYTGDSYGIVYDSGCAPGYINMLTEAEDNYNFIVDSGVEYAAYELANSRTVSVQRCDDAVLSLRYYDYINLGGVHGGYAYRAYNFDTTTGELITLDDLSNDSAGLKAFLKSYMLERVRESAELQQQMEGFVDCEGMPSTEEALSALVREGSWYMNDKGLLICSDLYELGSYAAGTMEFFIPFNSLEAYIKPQYIPETMTETGLFKVIPAEQLNESSKEIIDMLRLSDDGQALYLVAEGTAKNVRLAKVDYADRFYETETLWHCSNMTNCVLQLVTNVPEGMPELKISYCDAAGEHVYYLSQSGIDGSFILVGDNIEAVG